MKIAEGLVELLPRVRVFDREFQASLRRAGATRAEGRPPKIENGQRDLQTFAERSENIFFRHLHLAHRESPSRRAANSHFRHARFENFESRHVGRNQKCGDRRPSLLFPGTGVRAITVNTCAIAALVM